MICTYCGEPADTFDLAPQTTWRQEASKKSARKQQEVPACFECARKLSKQVLRGVKARAAHLATYYEAKYEKILKTPHWDDDEFEDMSVEFCRSIKKTLQLKHITLERLRHLGATVKANYTNAEARELFEKQYYHPIRNITLRWKSRDYAIQAHELRKSTGEYLFEHEAVERALELAEERGYVTHDAEIIVYR